MAGGWPSFGIGCGWTTAPSCPFAGPARSRWARWVSRNYVTFWKAVDDRGELTDLAERRRLFGEVVPTPHRARRLDLGCGGSKQPGFVGADRFPLANVDLVLDLDRPLPLADDTFDLVFASHSLEHVADLPLVMSEIVPGGEGRGPSVHYRPVL